jgi:hypothetical protein
MPALSRFYQSDVAGLPDEGLAGDVSLASDWMGGRSRARRPGPCGGSAPVRRRFRAARRLTGPGARSSDQPSGAVALGWRSRWAGVLMYLGLGQ